MPNQQIQDYINQSKAAGQTDEQIKSALRSSGWQEADIQEGFQTASGSAVQYSSGTQAPIGGQKKSSKKMVLIIVLILIILAGGAFAYWKFVMQKSNSVVQGTPSPSACNNYECLIVAASQCQPISADVSYSGIEFPLMPGLLISGQINYEIKKSSSADSCTLVFQALLTTFSISEEGRKQALASGVTDTQINTQLQAMNENAKAEVESRIQSICTGSAGVISNYLKDAKSGNYNAEVNSSLTESATTYTLSSGQKLVCANVKPAGQPANTSMTITNAECASQKGGITPVADDGTACRKNQIDIGSVTSGITINNKKPQCCVSK